MPSRLAEISRELAAACDRIDASSVAAFTYNPLVYARAPHELYLERFGRGKKEALWLGMNPGPFGMAQTGVPFGDVGMVRDFLGISGPVGRPPSEHPKRPVEGFACKKSEVSGTRLWGYMKDRYGSAEAMAERFFVVNYCPLVFMTESGSNLTPDKVPKPLAARIEAACDTALRAIVAELKPSWVIGVGAFAQKQAQRALAGQDIRIGTVLHPSPASPHANRGWAPAAQKQLDALGLG
ncbi:MAG TPA: uracil-DNA glycosylase family protein [Polyangiaceae bacterium]|nr:uracil-DNA glycosylase family protein [Polyangiaceae bacterium]